MLATLCITHTQTNPQEANNPSLSVPWLITQSLVSLFGSKPGWAHRQAHIWRRPVLWAATLCVGVAPPARINFCHSAARGKIKGGKNKKEKAEWKIQSELRIKKRLMTAPAGKNLACWFMATNVGFFFFDTQTQQHTQMQTHACLFFWLAWTTNYITRCTWRVSGATCTRSSALCPA